MTCYLDDDLDQDLLIRLAALRSHRLLSPRTLGRSGDHDALHFLHAVSQGLRLVTRNAKDFAALHEFGLGIGGHHLGLLVVYEEADRRKNMRINDIVNALTKLEAANLSLGDQLVALNHYR
jgi:hypothetical protein